MGYTYVMADLHGMYDKYVQMLRKIRFSQEDTLYVLGDAVDRGKDGIRLLLDFMGRDNVVFLLGNHEDMMLKVVCAEETESEDYERKCAHWFQNGGDVTAREFCNRLSYKEQAKLITYLERCPLALPDVAIGERHYYLVHACPVFDGSGKRRKANIITPDYLETLEKTEAQRIKEVLLWERPDGTEPMTKDTTLIFGHTPTIHYQKGVPMTIWHGPGMINIDCGCAYLARGREEGRLGCLRLEDEREFYVG